jgi:predicted NBD/HSP70 family sugar kinase
MNVLAIDIGGTNVKMLASGQLERRKFPSGPKLTPEMMVAGVLELVKDWEYDVVSIGYPGRIRGRRIVAEPYNIGRGWVGYDFQRAFGRPVKLINDGAMQALGCYEGGTLLFIGLGTGVGACLIIDGTIVPMEIGHLPYRKKTVEHYLGSAGVKRMGKKKWQETLEIVVDRLMAVFHPDRVVIGGGNARRLKRLPPGCEAGHNAFAFEGGFRLWHGELRAAAPTEQQVAGYH